jgi:hypothetical protein
MTEMTEKYFTDKQKTMIRHIVIIVVFFALIFGVSTFAECQEKLPDGSYIVTIEGKEYRALSADKIADLQTKLSEREAGIKKISLLEQALKNRQETIEAIKVEYDLKLQKSESQSIFWRDQYEKEKKVSSDIRKRMPICSFKILLFRVCL